MEKNTYTKPSLRASILTRIKAGSNGGSAGQWSARKAQLVALAYKKAGGGYKSSPTKKQASLKKWTKEKWGYSSKAMEDKPKTARYLPKKAWAKLSSSQKSATNRKKIASTKQFVANTKAAKEAGALVRNS